mmetsp:Transcript_28786/g.95670  ORF Transcript_28786/g.95670 Transcript_28786/m.95670 type:complete len:221 (+) Transcript_28786:515-1177(+)
MSQTTSRPQTSVKVAQGALQACLLLLDRLLVLRAEVQVSDGNVVEQNVEVAGTSDNTLSDHAAHQLALDDQLGGIVLGNDALQDLIDDAGKNLLVVVGAELPVDLGQLPGVGPGQAAQRDVDHLQILAARQGRRGVRPGADVEDDGALEPGHAQVDALPVRGGADATHAVVLDAHVAGLDRVRGVRQDIAAAGQDACASNQGRPPLRQGGDQLLGRLHRA